MKDLLQPLDHHGSEGREGGRVGGREGGRQETGEGELARGGSGTSLRKNGAADEVYVN